jgi:hypothetical protein
VVSLGGETVGCLVSQREYNGVSMTVSKLEAGESQFGQAQDADRVRNRCHAFSNYLMDPSDLGFILA